MPIGMAGGWWDGVGKAIEVVSGLAAGRHSSEDAAATPMEPRGMLGGLEARLAGVLVSALHEAFARDAARLDSEREQAASERRRAEAALRLEMARQLADRHLSQLRAVVAIDVVVWLASLLVAALHPAAGPSKLLLGCAWAALTAGLAAAFLAYARISAQAAILADVTAVPGLDDRAEAARMRPRALDAASWLAVSGLGLAAASMIVSMA
jgi:hypothetical protein